MGKYRSVTAMNFFIFGGNEQSTHKFTSELMGKETIDLDTHGKSSGRSGNYSTNYQISGRELMTPDEVRLLDNKYALLFIRGERPIKDLKYDILKHPNVAFTTDGKGKPYIHGKTDKATASIVVLDEDIDSYEIEDFENNELLENYELLSEEELEEFIKEVA